MMEGVKWSVAAKWYTADDASLKELRGLLCADGALDWRRCESCESACAFGKRMVREVAEGNMEDYTSEKALAIERQKQQKRNRERGQRQTSLLLRERAGKEVARVLGGACVQSGWEWAESLMEREAKLQAETTGRPTLEDGETETEIIEMYLRNYQGIHQFVMTEGA